MPIILPKCPDNYDLVKDNCRCKKQVKKTVKKTVKKSKKTTIKKNTKKSVKCSTQKKKECKTKKKVCNPLTGRCINPPKTQKIKKTAKKLTKKEKKKIIADKLKTLTKQRSYSPTINKEIERLAITPHDDLMTWLCKEDQINITKDIKDRGRCVGWKTKKAQQYLLENLRSKKKINAADIIGPQQSWDNCWFNTFFMMFFISDKGRKFMKAFRETMITGVIPGTKKKAFSDALRYPFWLLNKFITASLIGKKDVELYASLMDTNDIIKKIYKKLKRYSGKSELGHFTVTNVKEAGNPISMFLAIINYFYTQYSIKGFGIHSYRISHSYNDFMALSKKNSSVYNEVLRKKPHMIIIEFSDQFGNGKKPNGKDAQVKDFKKKQKFKIGNMEYKLDCLGIRDNKQHHICALVTLNGEDYMFDGENHTPLRKKKWRHLLNKNQNFKITPDISEQYNLTKGYQCLLYYRNK